MSQNVIHVVTPATVKLMVTNNRSDAFSETRFQKSITILDLKHRLELVTGIIQATMHLELYNKVGSLVAKLNDDNAMLGSFPVDDDMRLHVIGQSSLTNEFEDLSLVEKKVLSEEEYGKMNNTLRAYLMKNKLGKYSEKPEDLEVKPANDSSTVDGIVVGNRCEVSVPGQPTKRGEVKFVGETDFKPGLWVGIQYDEPLGKNDGSVDGKEYFKCPAKYGVFVRPQHVKIGDFPEEDYMNDEM